MLVVFEFELVETLAEFLHVVKHKNDVQNEEMDYCLAREKAQEVIACRELNVPYVVLDKPSFMSSLEGDRRQVIIDSNVDVKALIDDTPLVIRSNTRSFDCEALERFQSFVPAAAARKVTHWPKNIANVEKYLKRQVAEASPAIFNEAMRHDSLSPPFFIKGVEKGSGFSLHHVVQTKQELTDLIKSASELRKIYGSRVPVMAKDDDYLAFKQMPDWECPYRGLEKGRVYFFEPKDGVMISEALVFDHKPDHKAEYRCFIVNGKVSSISSYTDYKSYPVPDEIQKLADDFAAEYAGLAPGFVADFGMMDRGAVLVELNDFSHSGRYVGNDSYALYRDLEDFLGADRSSMKEPEVQVPPAFEDDDMDFAVSKSSDESMLVKRHKLSKQAGQEGMGLEP